MDEYTISIWEILEHTLWIPDETDHLIEAFPVILCHEAKGTEQRKAEVVEARVSIVGIWSDSDTRVVLWTWSANV